MSPRLPPSTSPTWAGPTIPPRTTRVKYLVNRPYHVQQGISEFPSLAAQSLSSCRYCVFLSSQSQPSSLRLRISSSHASKERAHKSPSVYIIVVLHWPVLDRTIDREKIPLGAVLSFSFSSRPHPSPHPTDWFSSHPLDQPHNFCARQENPNTILPSSWSSVPTIAISDSLASAPPSPSVIAGCLSFCGTWGRGIVNLRCCGTPVPLSPYFAAHPTYYERDSAFQLLLLLPVSDSDVLEICLCCLPALVRFLTLLHLPPKQIYNPCRLSTYKFSVIRPLLIRRRTLGNERLSRSHLAASSLHQCDDKAPVLSTSLRLTRSATSS